MKKLYPILLFIASCTSGKKSVEVGDFQKPTESPPPVIETADNFVSLDQMEADIIGYLEKLPNDPARQDTVFLVGCDRFNAGENMDSYEQGLNKAINILSTESKLAKLPVIGKGACTFALDLSTYGISRREWDLVMSVRQLQFSIETIRGQTIKALTQNGVPWVFADDFFLTAFEGDAEADRKCAIYCDLAEDPKDLNGYFANQGVNLQDEVNKQATIIAGFGRSQIALGKNRVVEVVESSNGYCMSTYDTSLAAQENAFLRPFTFEMANALGVKRSDKIFKHDAQEHICQLKNGMFGAFRLNGGDGQAASAAPNDVVVNTQFAGIDPTIRNVDCAACHHTEIAISFSDQVGPTIQKNASFNAQEKKLGEIYYDDKKMAEVLAEMNEQHQKALSAIGVTDAVDPFNNAVIRPFRQEMDANQIAGKVFMPKDDFVEALRGTSLSSQRLGNLTVNGTVSLGTLKQAFPDLVTELNLFKEKQL